MNTIFEQKDDWWRGLGIVSNSGLKLRKEYFRFDAENEFDIMVPEPQENEGCICGEILKGLKKPTDCKLFKIICNPENPLGACMVSHEGACQAYYRYC